jgi:molybdenum cofactor synthesis domain-containing protein
MVKQFLEIREQEEVAALISRVAAAVVEERTRTGRAEEKVLLSDALGRVTAADLFSALDVPPFDRATMDGYAVVAADTFYADEDHPASQVVKGALSAGEAPTAPILKGTCMAISTGAPLPKGADAVVKLENTAAYQEVAGGAELAKVRVYKPVAPGENVMPAGSDIARGACVVRRGTRLTPRETGVLAACGLAEVVVVKRPTVAIISTGNELIAPGEPLKPARIYDVNAQTLSDSVRDCGAIPAFLGVARDHLEELKAKLQQALDRDVEVILASGGTSAGVGDLLPVAAEAFGELLVHGVDIKPGKPFIFGRLHGKPFFGLPGNPTSALVTFSLFVAPLLRQLSGLAVPVLECDVARSGQRIKAKAAQRIFSERGRNEYVLVTLAVTGTTGEQEERTTLAYPLLSGSGAITTLAKADGYIYIEKGKELIEEGEPVEVKLFGTLPQS